MKQKQNKAAANGAKANKKPAPPKKVQEPVEENAEEEQEVVAKKPMNKRAAKNQKQVVKEEKAVVPNKKAAKKKAPIVPEVKEEPEEEEEQEDPEEMIQEEQEVDEEEQEDESDEDDEQEDEEMDGEEEGDEEPTIPSQIKSGEIDKSVECSKIIHITKLPKNCQISDVTKEFAKFGKIDKITMVTKGDSASAHISYTTKAAGKAALAAHNKVKILNSIVSVTLEQVKEYKTNHGLYIRNLKVKTTEEQLREHFKSCGEIESVRVLENPRSMFGFVVFVDKAADDVALKLHNSVLNGSNIIVVKNDPELSDITWLDRYDKNRTINVKNKQQFEHLDSEQVNKLQNILAKCGEIERFDVLCKTHILAHVMYKTKEAAQKALELNNKTIDTFELELDPLDPFKINNTIFVSNLPKDCTEEDLRKCFSRAGEIESVAIKSRNATIRFKDTDAYCKSFLYTESFIKRNMIFVEPFSTRKLQIIRSKTNGFKRGYYGKAYNGFKSKKPKTQ